MAITIISLVCSVITFAESNLYSAANQKAASQQIQNDIFNLSVSQMKNAITVGYEGFQSLSKFQAAQRLRIIDDKMDRWQPAISVNTPYYYIAMMSYSAFSKDQKYTLNDAKKIKNDLSGLNKLGFSVKAYGDTVDFAKNINIVLKQGSNVLQPSSITGKDDFAGDTGNSIPAYINILIPYFDIRDIDFSKPAELIYLYSGEEQSITYDLDFSKLK